MSEIVDLHTHSHFSDGELSPTDLLALAKENKVTMLALTDHDTTQGIPEAQAAAAKHNITLIPGVEISAKWLSHDIHIVGLNIDISNTELQNGLTSLAELRVTRARAIAAKLTKCGIKETFRAAQELAGKEIIARPHFAKVLIERGVVSDFQAAFKKYLGRGKPAYVPSEWASIENAVKWITAAGGFAVIAHPTRYKLNTNQLRRLVSAFKEAGGHGLEVGLKRITPDQTALLTRFCDEFDLVASAGSDFHGINVGWGSLGNVGALPPSCKAIWEQW